MNLTPLVFGLEDDLDDQESIILAFKEEYIFNYEFFGRISEFFALINPQVRVVVIDYNLPDGTGQEVLDRVRALIPKVRSTIISGIITPEMSVKLAFSGANACVEKKPGWEKELAKIVRKHIEEAEIELEQERQEQEEFRRKEEEKQRLHQTIKKLLTP
jgi:DNA-binding NtrC family response regulator